MLYALLFSCKGDESTAKSFELLPQGVQHPVIPIPLKLTAAKPQIR